MKTDAVEKKPVVQSVERALDILDVLAERRSPMRAAEIAAALGLHPNTAHNLIRTLYRRGYLLQMPDGRYDFGPQCYRIGVLCDPWEPLRQTARPLMQRLSQETGDNAFLGVYMDGALLCVTRTEGTGAIVVSPQQDWQDQLHCTATGKVLLAFGNPRWLPQLLAGTPLPRRTAATRVTSDELTREIEATRQQGYAFCRDESAEGVASIGVPLSSEDGTVTAALGQSFPTYFLDSGKIDVAARAATLQQYACELHAATAKGASAC